MLKTILAGLLVITLGAPPVMARTAPQSAIVKGEARLFGLPIFTSDGVQIGAVAETGTADDGYMVLLAQIEKPLVMEPRVVAIPVELIVLRADRVELLLTAAAITATLSRADDDFTN